LPQLDLFSAKRIFPTPEVETQIVEKLEERGLCRAPVQSHLCDPDEKQVGKPAVCCKHVCRRWLWPSMPGVVLSLLCEYWRPSGVKGHSANCLLPGDAVCRV